MKNPIYQEVLNYLEDKSYPLATRQIARNVIFKDHYDECDKRFNGKALVVPGKSSVQAAYYFLKNLEKQGQVKQCNRGTWKITKL